MCPERAAPGGAIDSPHLAARGLSSAERQAIRAAIDLELRRRAGIPPPPDPEGDLRIVRDALAAAGSSGVTFTELTRRIGALPPKRARSALTRLSRTGQIERAPGGGYRPLWRLVSNRRDRP
jgi:hypothetical protein